MKQEASLKKRYFYKLSANLFGVLMGLATMIFVPRALGPQRFGYFDYITDNFLLILTTLSVSFPIAYFNWISRKGHKENSDVASGVTLYLHFFVIAFFIIFLLGSIFWGGHSYIWPKVPIWVLWSGLVYASFTFLFQFLSYLADGRALTVGLEKIRLLQNTLRTVGLTLLFFLSFLTLQTYFLLQTVLLILAVAGLVFWLISKKVFNFTAFKFRNYDSVEVQNYFSFSVLYIKPLLLLTIVSFTYSFFDRWFLQIIGGAAEQGFYSISYKLGAFAFIFTNSMTPVLTREFAYAFEENSIEKMRVLFNRIKIFLFIAAVFGIFISVQSNNIVQIIGGKSFIAATIPIAIMAFYPIHQTFGQLSAALLLSSGQTKLYSRIGMFTMLLGIPVTYLLIAPKNFFIPGLQLGSIGLAVKMVIIQIIGTNIQLYFNTKHLGFSFREWIWIQIRLVVIIYFIGTVASFSGKFVDMFWKYHHSFWLIQNFAKNYQIAVEKILFSGLIYILLIGLLVMVYPPIVGITFAEIRKFGNSLSNKLLKKNS